MLKLMGKNIFTILGSFFLAVLITVLSSDSLYLHSRLLSEARYLVFTLSLH